MKKSIHGLAVGIAAATIALLLWSAGVLDRWEYATWSWRVQAFAEPTPATNRIKLILLDQASLDWGEKQNGLSWPWPREVYGPIIDFCKRSGARALIFDVLYTESSVYGVADDRALGAAIGRAPPFVGALYLSNGAGQVPEWPSIVPRRLYLQADKSAEPLMTASTSEMVMQRAIFPIDEVAGTAEFLASTADDPDMDGIFRRVFPLRIFREHPVPSLGLAAFLAGREAVSRELTESLPQAFSPIELALHLGLLIANGREIPIDRHGKMILRYRGGSGTYEAFSAASVIQSELLLQAGEKPVIDSPAPFKDCYVFFGFSAPGLLDLRPTPISKVTPGVEIYATMLDNLLSGDFLRETPAIAAWASTAFLAFLSSLVVVTFSRKAWHSMVSVAIFIPLPGIIGFAAYPLGFWWPITLHESAVALSLFGAMMVNYATVGREKARIKNAFKHYLSPQVIERILADPSHLKLGGERRELTIFFSDLQGFSSISERLEPEALTSLLNDYLSDMTDIILDEGGTLDKYEGDAIIAFWNAPLALPDHAERACRAAVRCQLKLEERREELRKRTGVLLRARIGLNTGEVVVGNMGSHKRFDYTVLGDAANLASRLEGANKPFGTYIMVSEDTWSQTRGKFPGREIGLLRVVGRKTPVRVFEILGLPGDEKSPKVEKFEAGLALCISKQWQRALETFEGLPDDPVARVYAEKCRALAGNSGEDWDCIWNLTEK